jgi:hypothetical protein
VESEKVDIAQTFVISTKSMERMNSQRKRTIMSHFIFARFHSRVYLRKEQQVESKEGFLYLGSLRKGAVQRGSASLSTYLGNGPPARPGSISIDRSQLLISFHYLNSLHWHLRLCCRAKTFLPCMNSPHSICPSSTCRMVPFAQCAINSYLIEDIFEISWIFRRLQPLWLLRSIDIFVGMRSMLPPVFRRSTFSKHCRDPK